MLYIKPEIKSYSAGDLLEELGPCQNQYTTTTTTFYTTTGNSSVNLDGYIEGPDNFIITTNSYIVAGDNGDDEMERGFVGFDISGITGRTIVSATLRLYQFSVINTPYTDLGTAVVDHVNFGSSLDSADQIGNTLTSNIGTLSTNTTVEWKTLDVSSSVQADLDAGRTSSQFRIRFTTSTDSDGSGEFGIFEDAENSASTGNRPELVVTYR